MKEMITTVGPENSSTRMCGTVVSPLDEDPGFMRRYRGRQAIRDLIESLLAPTIWTHLLSSMARRRRLRKMFPAPRRPPVTRLSRASRRRHCVFHWPPRHRHAAGYTKDNLPVGIEFIGKSFDDLRLLQVAYGYEQATRSVGRRRSAAAARREIRLLNGQQSSAPSFRFTSTRVFFC